MKIRPSGKGRIRYDWWRAHHGLPNHPKWRGVAHSAGVPVSVVVHIVLCLLDHASQASPRGSIEAFKTFDCAGTVDVTARDVERTLEILRVIHWIEGHMIAEWDSRQPQREDQGAASRKAAQRERDRQNVTHSKRDTESSHTAQAGQSNQTSNVTELAAPDKRIYITTTSSVAEEPKSARSLATALPAGALAREPQTKPASQKRVSELTRAELDALITGKHQG